MVGPSLTIVDQIAERLSDFGLLLGEDSQLFLGISFDIVVGLGLVQGLSLRDSLAKLEIAAIRQSHFGKHAAFLGK